MSSDDQKDPLVHGPDSFSGKTEWALGPDVGTQSPIEDLKSLLTEPKNFFSWFVGRKDVGQWPKFKSGLGFLLFSVAVSISYWTSFQYLLKSIPEWNDVLAQHPIIHSLGMISQTLSQTFVIFVPLFILFVEFLYVLQLQWTLRWMNVDPEDTRLSKLFTMRAYLNWVVLLKLIPWVGSAASELILFFATIGVVKKVYGLNTVRAFMATFGWLWIFTIAMIVIFIVLSVLMLGSAFSVS